MLAAVAIITNDDSIVHFKNLLEYFVQYDIVLVRVGPKVLATLAIIVTWAPPFVRHNGIGVGLVYYR